MKWYHGQSKDCDCLRLHAYVDHMHAAPTSEQLAWERTVPPAITSDVIWKLDVYRLSLYVLHLSLLDCQEVRTRRPESKVVEQLARAAGSISANLAEGYGRSSRADRLRFFNYALGSTRECISWYTAIGDVLAAEVIEARLNVLARIRAATLGLIRSPRERESARRMAP